MTVNMLLHCGIIFKTITHLFQFWNICYFLFFFCCTFP